jgi:predicted phage terminase large subunit-like protein
MGAEARQDFRAYARFVLGLKIRKHQKAWADACQDIGDNPRAGKKYLLVAPRGFGKTTLVAIGLSTWMIGKYPLDHVGLLSYVDKVAWSRAVAIRRVLKNSTAYHFTFPNNWEDAYSLGLHPVIPDPASWGSAEFRLLKEGDHGDPHPTMRSGGVMSAVIAYRLNGLLIDDPTSEKYAATADLREKGYDNYATAILPTLTAGAWRLCIGTRFADDDFIGRLIKKGGWEMMHLKALDDRGRTTWPEEEGPNGERWGYSTQLLQQMKFDDPVMFAMQYQGDTSGGEQGIIRFLDTYDDEPTPEWAKEKDLLIAFGIDTATKDKEKNDFHVIYVAGLDPQGRVYILERVRLKCGVPELIKEIERLYWKWTPFQVLIEDASSGTPAVQTMKIDMPHIPTVLSQPTQGGKSSRAHAMSGYIHGGHVLFPQFESWYNDVEYELTHFGHTSHDDDVDALFQVLIGDEKNNKLGLLRLRHPAAMASEKRPEFRIRFD